MKKLFILIALSAPAMLHAQTTTQKVAYLKVGRLTGATTTARLSNEADVAGPTLKLEEGKLYINNTSIARSRIKDFRFEIKTEQVDAIEQTEAQEQKDKRVYDLQGRALKQDDSRTRNIYVKGGKKYVKK